MSADLENSERILVVEDDGNTRAALASLLELEGYAVKMACGGDEGAEIAEHWSPDLVLSDVNMPRGDGLGLVSRLRNLPSCEDTSIVLISALHDANRRVRGLDTGADDFLGKPVDPSELLARIRSHLRNTRQRRELRESLETDALTGLHNRAGIERRLTLEVERCERGANLCVIVLDLDDFKKINDVHGHIVGDMALKQVGNGLRQVARCVDSCARWGGDEFVVLLTDCRPDAVEKAGQRLRDSVEGELVLQDGSHIPIRCSLGLSGYSRGDTAATLLARADANMYIDKRRRGRQPGK